MSREELPFNARSGRSLTSLLLRIRLVSWLFSAKVFNAGGDALFLDPLHHWRGQLAVLGLGLLSGPLVCASLTRRLKFEFD